MTEASKKSTLSRMIRTLVVIIPSMINVICYLKCVIEREAQRFLNNIIIIIILSVLSAILLSATWFLLLGLLYLYLITKLTVVMSLCLLLFLNLLILFFISLYMIKIKNHLFDFEI
jgi:hypothetical protein